MTQVGRDCVVQGPLSSDILSCSHPLYGVDIGLKLFLNKANKFLVYTPGDQARAPRQFRLTLSECTLLVPRLKFKANVSLPKSLTYKYLNHRISTWHHSKDVQAFGPQNVCSGSILPNVICVMLASEKRHSGDLALNDLLFKHENVSAMLLTVNGAHKPVYGGLRADFTAQQYTNVYRNFFDVLKSKAGISYLEFDSYTIFAFDTSDAKCGTLHHSKSAQNQGVAELTITFKEALKEDLRIYVFQIYSSLFTIENGTFMPDIHTRTIA